MSRQMIHRLSELTREIEEPVLLKDVKNPGFPRRLHYISWKKYLPLPEKRI